MDFTALQVKTCYSLLSSLNNISKLVTRANDYGYKALAITDNMNMFGVMEFYQECQKKEIKPLIGMELHISKYEVLLYAKNIKGYKNLIKLASIGSTKDLTIDDLKQYRSHLILVMPVKSYYEEIFNIYTDHFIGYNNMLEREQYIGKKVFINDVSYLEEKDAEYLEYLKMIKEGKLLGEYAFDLKGGKHLLTIDEALKLVNKEDYVNYQYIIDNCNVTLSYTKDLLPRYDKNLDSYQYLTMLTNKGLKKRLNNNTPKEYQERLAKELEIINKMGFNDYFLIVYDYVLYAKKKGILVGPGRGSAAGSLVSYTLGITDIDPLKYNLLFERFLNSERKTMPDIDIDFDALRRQEVIDYVTNKYGKKKVVGIITFNTLGAKQVIRDVGKILKINASMVDMVAKLCTGSLMESYQRSDRLKKIISTSSEIKKMYQICLHLEGLPRHISIHAAGVVMSNKDLDEIIPIYQNQLGMYLSGYSKDYLEPLGLLKMDFLGINNLTMIDEIIQNIRNDKKINIKFSNIPLDDKMTFDLFKRAETNGIFQFESPGMIKFLKQLQVTNFNDIVSAIALYRPGPMESIPEYLKRRTGQVKTDYLHPDLIDILKDTYGIIIYQEQIMQIACQMAGYTLGEADILRRAMSKKKASLLLAEENKFISKSVALGYPIETVKKVYDLILKFANYGFNKSHAVSYSMIAYKMAFLKVHFYSYFMISLLNNVIGNEKKTSIYIAMLRRKQITVLKPDINKSIDKYIVLNGEIIPPLTIIRGVGRAITQLILLEKEKGEFKNFIDFAKRMYNKGINHKILENLILASTFDALGYNKNTLINNLDNILNYVDLSQEDGLITVPEPTIDHFIEYREEEIMLNEFNLFGFYLTSHPVSQYKDENSLSTFYLDNYVSKYVKLVLEINNIKETVTKNNDIMAFIKASDEYSQITLVLFPQIYEKYHYLKQYDIIKSYGKVEKRLDEYNILVSQIDVLKEVSYDKKN